MLFLFQAIRSYFTKRKEKKQRAIYDAYREQQRVEAAEWEQAVYESELFDRR